MIPKNPPVDPRLKGLVCPFVVGAGDDLTSGKDALSADAFPSWRVGREVKELGCPALSIRF